MNSSKLPEETGSGWRGKGDGERRKEQQDQRRLKRSPADGNGTAETSGSCERSGKLETWERNSSRTWYTLHNFSLYSCKEDKISTFNLYLIF